MIAVQTDMFPEQIASKLERDIDKIRKKLFAENSELKKEIVVLEAHLETLATAVLELEKRLTKT